MECHRADAHTGRSRAGLTSKVHAAVDANGLPVCLGLTPGEAHDNRLCAVLLAGLRSETMLLADRGYDGDRIRAFVDHKGAWVNIRPKQNRKAPICFSPYFYRARNLVERFSNKIKQCRRVATRYDKLAAKHVAFIKLASIRIWLCAYEFTLWFTRRAPSRVRLRSPALATRRPSLRRCGPWSRVRTPRSRQCRGPARTRNR
jgi:transposase